MPGWGHLSKKQVIALKSKKALWNSLSLWNPESKLAFAEPHFKISRVGGQARVGATLTSSNSARIGRPGTGGPRFAGNQKYFRMVPHVFVRQIISTCHLHT